MGVWHWQSDKTCTSSYNEPGHWSSEVFSFPLKQRNLSLLVWQILLKLKYSAASIKAVTESTDKCRQTLLLWQGKEWSCWFSYPDTPCERKHQTQSWSVLLKGMAKSACMTCVPSLRIIYDTMVWETNQKWVICGWGSSKHGATYCLTLVLWLKYSLLTDSSKVWCCQESWQNQFLLSVPFSCL